MRLRVAKPVKSYNMYVLCAMSMRVMRDPHNSRFCFLFSLTRNVIKCGILFDRECCPSVTVQSHD